MSTLLLSSLVTVFAVDRALGCLPSLSIKTSPAANNAFGSTAKRQVGLDDSFILDGKGGLLDQMQGERLVHATDTNDEELPPDTYLRCGFFTTPSMDRWRIGVLRTKSHTNSQPLLLHAKNPEYRVRSMRIERFSGAAKFIFLPPNPLQLSGLDNLLVNLRSEWIRPMMANDDSYLVTYQNLDIDTVLGRAAAPITSPDLINLPPDLDINRFRELIDEWGVSNQPRQAMKAVAAGLAKHCSYSRAEPTGPFEHALDNFLFAPTNRQGYCMHFASAAALMLRLQGIPCRIGVGLFGGEPDNDSSKGRIFGSQHAHAWVEIPSDQNSFYIFDPTPPSSRGRTFPSEFQPDGSQASDPNVTFGPALLTPLIQDLTQVLSKPGFWAALIAIVIGLSILPRKPSTKPLEPQQNVVPGARQALKKLLSALASAGHQRTPGQTLELFANDIASRCRLAPDVSAAIMTYQEIRFGGRPLDSNRRSLMDKGVKAALAMKKDKELD